LNIKLHLGAHKTATTHIQAIFENSQDSLEKNNIKLSTPKELRKEWISSLLKVSNGEDSYIENIKKISPNNGTWIISDENIVGVSYDLKLYSGIYPNMIGKLKAIKSIFPTDAIEIFFSIRSYDEFYRSSYLEVVRNRGYIPFEEFYNQKRFQDNSWISVIEAFLTVLPQENITIWCYEDFKDIMPLIISKLTGLDKVDEIISSYKMTRTRPSLSSKTINILKSYYLSNNIKYGNSIIESLNEKYPISNNNPAYFPFNNKVKFQEKYIEDIKLIKNKYSKINFLGLK
jgi:hypothetical protein